MRCRRLRVASALVAGALVLVVVPATPTVGAAPEPADLAAAVAAVDWLVGQQEPDGGFELASFPGFETPDAVLAIAEAGQTGATWSTVEARAAVEALEYGGSGGPTPIDALDTWVTGGVNAGEASKLLLLVVDPLGLDPAEFGPSQTDLAAIVYPNGCADAPDTAGIFFYETMFVGFGGEVLCGAPHPAVVDAIRDAQRPDGGWNFNGSTAPVDPGDPFDPNQADVDTTAVALAVLVAGGATWDDPAILGGLRYLAGQHQPSGAFPAFGADDPNATSVGTLAIAAAGFDPTSSCWRDTADPAAAGTPYASPLAWIRSQQQPDGRIASPNDGYGLNTFATSQSVQTLLRGWLPVARATGAPDCAPVASADPVALVPRFTG